MNRSNTSANKDIGHIVKDMLRLLVAYGVAGLFLSLIHISEPPRP